MDIEELQKFAIFIYSVGVTLFWLREKNCYTVGLGFLISSLIAKLYYDSVGELANETIMARYLVSGLFIVTMSLIYYLYYKNETYIHNLRGNKSTFSNYKKTCTPSSNDYGGKHNSAFAKIPLNLETGNTVLHETTFLSNVYFYEPPLERLSKLKFKFRYHDGRLVDFRNYPISITLEINQLKEEISRNYNIRVPESYGL